MASLYAMLPGMASPRKVAVSFPDDVLDRIDAALAPGQSRSGWVAAACRAHLDGPTVMSPAVRAVAARAEAKVAARRGDDVEPRFK